MLWEANPLCYAQVFGHVTSGFDIVKEMEKYGTQGGTPSANITITVRSLPHRSSRDVQAMAHCRVYKLMVEVQR
jgi:hypothetical protein